MDDGRTIHSVSDPCAFFFYNLACVIGLPMRELSALHCIQRAHAALGSEGLSRRSARSQGRIKLVGAVRGVVGIASGVVSGC
jgi:hypothetical protein